MKGLKKDLKPKKGFSEGQPPLKPLKSRGVKWTSAKKSDSSKSSQQEDLKGNPSSRNLGKFQLFKQKTLKKVQNCPRTVTLAGQCSPNNYQNNIVKNTKYNIFTFVPLVLFHQFKFFFNLFFLVTALTQLVEVLRVGLFITFIGPLIMVLSLTMAKEGYDDYRTYRRDIEANSKVYEVIREDKKQKLKSKDLKIGDLVLLNSGDRVPADMVTLYSTGQQGTLFVKTDQIDGETDWKLRKAVKKTQSIVENSDRDYHRLYDPDLHCTVKAPSGQIYSFNGVFSSEPQQMEKQLDQNSSSSRSQAGEQGPKQKLTLDNTLWASCVLTNGHIVGLVVYIGKETRVAMGGNTPRTKVGILDLQINFLSKVLFFIVVGLTTLILILQRPDKEHIVIQFTRIIILLSSIIPISMRVNLDFAKLFYSRQINYDKQIEGTITRNSNCPEQLGRVRYILSDKTGTLTQNEMLFRSISIEDEIKFTHENMKQMCEVIKDYENITQSSHSKKRLLKEIITALAVCHNVTPVTEDSKENSQIQSSEEEEKLDQSHNISRQDAGSKPKDQQEQKIQSKQKIDIDNQKIDQQQSYHSQHSQHPRNSKGKDKSQQSSSEKKRDFQASSPDQITFVKTVESLGIQLKQRSQTEIILQLPSQKTVKYEILHMFPFSSETKRMGIIVKNQETNQIDFYLKGADSVMKRFIHNQQKKGFIEQECRDLSMSGLRTLVIAKKSLTEQKFKKWSERYHQANNKLQIDKKQIEQIMHQLENGVEFLGVTGIQDKLQDNLKATIQALKSAKIKVWMITGDKVETAQCISRSCGIQHVAEDNVKVVDVDDLDSWKEHWEGVKLNLLRVLIIDGKTLTLVLENNDSKERREDFFKTAMQMPAVICCRCSPQQKKILTEGVKSYKEKKQAVLGIGDGGNDVGMIQAADVGVGVVGKEGNQAALAADFSINEFQNLKCLLLWHGRLSYKRSALLASFIVHRGFLISIIQIIFTCVYHYLSIPVFNSYLLLGYTTLFTFCPVFSLILDTDVDKKRALKYPVLYDSLQNAHLLTLGKFMSWIWKATFQGTVIMFLSILFFEGEAYRELETICFTTLILTEYCMVFAEINRIHILTICTVAVSLLLYSICLFLLNDFVQVSPPTWKNFLIVCMITAASWGPIALWKILRKKFFPNDYETVMKNVKRSKIAKQLLKNSFKDNSDKHEPLLDAEADKSDKIKQ